MPLMRGKTRVGDALAGTVAEIQGELKRLRKQIVLTADSRIEIADPLFADVSKSAGASLPADRRWILWQAVRNVAATGGAAADVGPQRHGTAPFIEKAFEALGRDDVRVDAIEAPDHDGLQPSYALVHLDVDGPQATLECLRRFGPPLVAGGVILLEGYGSGVHSAVDTFLAEADEFQQWHLHTQQLLLLKDR